MTREQALRAHLKAYGKLHNDEVEAIIVFVVADRESLDRKVRAMHRALSQIEELSGDAYARGRAGDALSEAFTGAPVSTGKKATNETE